MSRCSISSRRQNSLTTPEYAQTFVAQKSRTKKFSRAALRRELAERRVRSKRRRMH